MAQYELFLPKMGESIAEATIIKWLKKPGDLIEFDEPILEIATDKVDSEVPAPISGVLKQQFYAENDVVQIGAKIAIIEIADDENKSTNINQDIPPSSYLNQKTTDPVFEDIKKDNSVNNPNTMGDDTVRFYSPLVKNIAKQEGLSNNDLQQIIGTGENGRITKTDVFDYINSRKETDLSGIQHVNNTIITPIQSNKSISNANNISENITEITSSSSIEFKGPLLSDEIAMQKSDTKGHENAQAISSVHLKNNLLSDEIIEMDRMRKLISEHMIMSKNIAAHVTSFVEADVTKVVKWREKVKNTFEKREGEKITFTPIFIESVSKALRDFPMVNVSLNGTQIIKKKDINIGMAAALPNGNLIVPVIKNADQLNLVGLTKIVNDLAQRARTNQLKPDEIQNGTFTISNIGSFGNIMGTPIINQPQVAILAVGTIKKKPAVIETEYGDVIAIRHMMYLSLSYDHRIVDGALGGLFLKRIADYLENWDENTLL